ncbi:MAG TPA: TonB family protein [Desulfomonilia bacterium]|nr:TonB family protein [Desulfomonilia bacterium]
MVCLALSILVHIFIIVQPVHLLVNPESSGISLYAVPVRLIDLPLQETPSNNEKASEKLITPPKNQEETEGVSFVAEGGVGVVYLSKLKVKIFRIWQYPRDAILKGQQGKVAISFVINSNGVVENMGVVSSSGSKSLDTAAMDAIKQASPYGPFSPDIKESTLKVTGHFSYVLD